MAMNPWSLKLTPIRFETLETDIIHSFKEVVD